MLASCGTIMARLLIVLAAICQLVAGQSMGLDAASPFVSLTSASAGSSTPTNQAPFPTAPPTPSVYWEVRMYVGLDCGGGKFDPSGKLIPGTQQPPSYVLSTRIGVCQHVSEYNAAGVATKSAWEISSVVPGKAPNTYTASNQLYSDAACTVKSGPPFAPAGLFLVSTSNPNPNLNRPNPNPNPNPCTRRCGV